MQRHVRHCFFESFFFFGGRNIRYGFQEKTDLQSTIPLVIWVTCLFVGLLQFLFTALCLFVYRGEVQVEVRRR